MEDKKKQYMEPEAEFVGIECGDVLCNSNYENNVMGLDVNEEGGN